jgi:predicted O-methyltransferase YrrM
LSVRRVGRWSDAVRRLIDGILASSLPGGYKLFPVLSQVDGYLLPHEGVFLYWLARGGPGDGAIVEIGSFRGRSTLCLAAGAQRRKETLIYAIDPHVYRTAEELRENLEHFGASKIVRQVVQPSTEVAATWQRGLRAIFVDGDHAEAAVAADVEAWLPHLLPGGFLLLHDSTGPAAFAGPAAVVRQRIDGNPEFDLFGRLGSITWARRGGGSEPWTPPQWGRRTLEPVIMHLKARKAAQRNRV